jgi:hypothetical protein
LDQKEDDLVTNTDYQTQAEFMQDRCDDFPEFEDDFESMKAEAAQYEEENKQNIDSTNYPPT